VLSLFRTNQLVANALLIFYILLLRFSSFIVAPPEHVVEHAGLLSANLYNFVDPNSSLSQALAIVLVFMQAFLINIITARFRIARTVSLFPGLFYVLLTSFFPEFLYLSPVLLANTFIILALYEILGSYKQYYSNGRIYNAGLWVGLASLFYFSTLIFLAALFITFIIVRAFKLKEQLGMLLGFVSPFWLVAVYYYTKGQLPRFWDQAWNNNIGWFDLSLSDLWIDYIQLGVFGLFILIAILSYRTYTYKVSIQAQKFIDVFFWFLAFTALTVLIQANIRLDHLLLLAVPLSFLIGMSFLYMNKRLAEALHFLLLAGIFLLQFKSFWYMGN